MKDKTEMLPFTNRAYTPRRRRLRPRRTRLIALLAIISVLYYIYSRILYPAPRRPQWADTATTDKQRAAAVRDVFQFAWRGYYRHAFPNDELHPLLNLPGNSRNGWGASAIDALGTAIIMDLPEVVDQIMEHVPTIDFTKTKTKVNMFETTIRYLGGMLSAYDLLTGPMHHLARKGASDALLKQSVVLADSLKYAFDTPTGVPWKTLLLEKQESDGSVFNSGVAVGSMILEWCRLADLTGNDEYQRLAEKALEPMLHPQPDWAEALPGIVGNWINVETGDFADDWGTWGPGGDSFYEYLIKMYAYNQTRYVFNKERWTAAAGSVMSDMTVTPKDTDLKILSRTDGTTPSHESTHMECFAGGNFIFAGKLLKEKKYTDFGIELTRSCHEMYKRTATGIGPEKIRWPPATLDAEQEKQFKQLGFAIEIPTYQLRPETIESYYYAYRATGDKKYQQWAWDAFVAIVTHTKTRNGFAPLSNVNKIGAGWKLGRQESFLFAELLKYTYLIFAEDAEYQFNHKDQDDWVFNTEGHPLKTGANKGTPG